MWPRIAECMFGIWLLMSPFIFRHSEDAAALWANDLTVGSILIVLSLASYWRPTGWAHWLLFPMGAWLVGFGRLSDSPPLEAALQNEILTGLLLMMFSIIPNWSAQPPAEWKQEVSTPEH